MRYRVIVVDDNPLITQMLSQAVDYEKFGCVLSGTASNGQEGKELIDRVRPHIIFADVQMPIMDGFSMLDACQDTAKNARVIILSGFDDFRYAQKGIERRVFGYILKPGRIAQIEDILRRVVDELVGDETVRRMLDAAARLKKGQALSCLLQGDASDQREAVKEAGLARGGAHTLMGMQVCSGMAPSAEDAALIVENAPGAIQSAAARIDRRLWVAAAFGGECTTSQVRAHNKWLEDALMRLVAPKGAQVCFCHSQLLEGAHNLQRAYREGCAQLDYQAFAALPRLSAAAAGPGFQETLEDMIARLTQNDARAALSLLDPMLDALGPYCAYQLDRARQALCDALLALSERTPARVAPTGAGEMANARTMDSAREILQDAILSVEDAAAKPQDTPLLVVSVLNYVKDNYAQDITLSKLADQFFVSPNHLGKLFKNATGKTFTHYLNHVRIQRAKRLLMDPTIRINEIADSVGYSGYIYFYQVFKKYVGVSPVTYRNKNHIEG